MKALALAFFVSLLSFSCNNKKESNSINVNDVPKDDTVAIAKAEKTVNAYSPVDVSPMDMSYFPVDYPKLKMSKDLVASSPWARVIYSRPHLQGRHIFHEVLKYGEPWRLGANESTELELYKDATIQGEKVKAGRYILYCIPQPNEWTIVFNNNTDTWGLQQDPSKDIVRFTVPVKKTATSLEFFTMIFEGKGEGAILLMAWDNVEVRLPISF
ncbi:MAG: DUF2911 domain-containing protein [Chitinophagaceae bacterium]